MKDPVLWGHSTVKLPHYQKVIAGLKVVPLSYLTSGTFFWEVGHVLPKIAALQEGYRITDENTCEACTEGLNGELK